MRRESEDENGFEIEIQSGPLNINPDEDDSEDESWSTFLLRLLLLNSENPFQIGVMLMLYLAVCLFSASPSWFGPQSTLSEIYDVQNITDNRLATYSDVDAVALNAILRENALMLTLTAFSSAERMGVPDVLSILTTASVTIGDTFLNVLSGTAASPDHWGKGPLLYAAAGTTFFLLSLVNFRSVTDLYKRQYRNWRHPEEAEYIVCLDAAVRKLYTFPVEDRPRKSAKMLAMHYLPKNTLEHALYSIQNDAKNLSRQNERMAVLKDYCARKGLLSGPLSFYAVDIPGILYAMVGAAIANYELVQFLIKKESPIAAIVIPATFSFYAKSCFYGFSLFNIIHCIRNFGLLCRGAAQTSSQDKQYALIVGAIILGFFAFIPLSGLSFFIPTNNLFSFIFKDWAEQKTDAYLYGVLPAFGAMGSIANSIGYIGLCTRLLGAFRKKIDRDTLSKRNVSKYESDVCVILEKEKDTILKETEPDKQSIAFFVEMLGYSFKRLRDNISDCYNARNPNHFFQADYEPINSVAERSRYNLSPG